MKGVGKRRGSRLMPRRRVRLQSNSAHRRWRGFARRSRERGRYGVVNQHSREDKWRGGQVRVEVLVKAPPNM
jgi:hypothetical protein